MFPKLDWLPRPFRAKTTLESLGRDPVESYFHTVSIMRGKQRTGLYSDGFRRFFEKEIPELAEAPPPSA